MRRKKRSENDDNAGGDFADEGKVVGRSRAWGVDIS